MHFVPCAISLIPGGFIKIALIFSGRVGCVCGFSTSVGGSESSTPLHTLSTADDAREEGTFDLG